MTWSLGHYETKRLPDFVRSFLLKVSQIWELAKWWNPGAWWLREDVLYLRMLVWGCSWGKLNFNSGLTGKMESLCVGVGFGSREAHEDTGALCSVELAVLREVTWERYPQ